MHLLDIIIGIFVLAFVFNGLRKGFIKSVLGLLGLIVIIILIIKIGNPVKIMLIRELGINEILAVALAYILIIFFITIVVKIIGWMLSKIMNILNAGCLDRILGMVFGFLNGVLIIAIVLILLDITPMRKSIRKFTNDSVAVQYIRKFTLIVDKNFPEANKFKVPIEKTIEDLDQKITDAVEEKTKK
ncbi:MAG: CvpA family protein [Candidatus Cloacimonetes bacterium]|nr:CvpA family protein [Candidatus Cloacimonadota bacterium]MCF7814018.1 CvpA family protein [Candidatus Cloacimonadota bacterium]MCF7868078.1 CvpA family protein [Candidatus Cloacimonadota bacterium]MCF7883501.1 CvpA family protein [Candidatus Cloacimonadota bacterium]